MIALSELFHMRLQSRATAYLRSGKDVVSRDFPGLMQTARRGKVDLVAIPCRYRVWRTRTE
jgi:hypothetical protein